MIETFTKSYVPQEFEAELVKARLLHKRSVGTSFSSPAVLMASPDSGEIEYEHLDCSQSLMDALADSDLSRDSIMGLLSVVGSCLAAIHEISPPSASVRFHRSELFNDALASRAGTELTEIEVGQGVLQHGDFGFTNIFVTGNGDLVIIDPSPNQYLSVHPLNVDFPELDLAILVSHLIGRASSPVALGRSAVFGRAMIDAVISGYEITGSEIDRQRLRLFTRAGVDAVRLFASSGSQAHRRAILKPLSAVLSRNIS